MSITTESDQSSTSTDRMATDTDGSDGGGSALTFDALAVLAFAIALMAVVIAVFAVGLAARSIDEHRAAPVVGSSSSATVALDEFTITPTPLQVSAGSSVSVTNDGSAVHDLAVEGQDLMTPELNPGESAELDVGGLSAGAYTVYCQVPGHRESGMESELTIG